jgi:DNA-directed RNA polymerase specialized sigma24 family protein/ribosome-associated translation inhibitor RaiA
MSYLISNTRIMEYKIHHLDLVSPASQQPFFEQEVMGKMERLQKILKSYPHELVIDIYVKKEGNDYIITASLSLPGKKLTAEEKGSQPVLLVINVLDRLRGLIKKQIQLQRKEFLYKRKTKFQDLAENSRAELENRTRKKDSGSFVQFAKQILPEIQKHIRKEIWRKPVLARLIKKNLIELNDIIDEVYLHLYETLQKNSDAPEKLVLWTLAESDKKIKELTKKYSKQFKDAVSTEKLNNQEYDELREELTANADFKPELVDELEEKFFSPGEYDLHEILTDAGAEEEIINKAGLDDENIDIEKMLREFPEEQQSVFELYYRYRFGVDEIAHIKNKNENEIEEWLHDIRTYLLESVMEHA